MNEFKQGVSPKEEGKQAMRRNGTKDETSVAVIEQRDPAIASLLSVVLMPQKAEGTDGDGEAIDPRTMLTVQQSANFRDQFAGLLTAFCDTREANSETVARNLEQARIATAALRTAIGGNGNGHETATKKTTKDVMEIAPAVANPPRKKRAAKAVEVKLSRPGSKECASRLDGPKPGSDKAIALNVITEAGQQGITGPEIKAKQPGLGRINNILRALLDDGYIRNITGGGRGNKGIYVAVSQDGAKGEPGCANRSDSPRVGSQVSIALEVITSAGAKGTTAAKIKEQKPELKHINTTLRALIKSRRIRNIGAGGRGNKAVYVAVSQVGEDTGIDSASAAAEKSKGGRWLLRGASRPRQNRKGADKGDTEADGAGDGDPESAGGESHRKPEKVHSLSYWKAPKERRSRSSKPPPAVPVVPRLKRLLPTRPTPLPPTALVTKEPTNPNEWDELIMRILTDWNWQLMFPQLLIALKEEGPSYGYSIGGWSSTRIENEARYSVMRLERANRLRIGEDRVTLSPVKTLAEIEAARPVENSHSADVAEKSTILADNRMEFKDLDDWYLAVMQVIQEAEGSITKSDIVDNLQEDELADWRLPSGISAETMKEKVGLAIVALAEDKVIVPDDEVEAGNEEDIQWRIA